MVPRSYAKLRRVFAVIVLALPLGLVVVAPDIQGDPVLSARGGDTASPKQLRPQAEKGDARAQYALAFMYLRGNSVPQDDAEAVTWLRKAAGQGHAKAQYSLAILYHVGLGVRQSDSAAAAWFRKAAEQGHARAQDSLAFMYLRGEGVPRDEAKAARWSRMAAAQGRGAAPDTSRPAVEEPPILVKPDTAPQDTTPQDMAPQDTAKPDVAKLLVATENLAKKAPPVLPRGDFRIQLGSVKLKARAVKEAGRLNRIHRPVLGGLTIVPVRASLGRRGVFYRLRAGPINDRAAAKSLCRKLSALKQRCMVSRR